MELTQSASSQVTGPSLLLFFHKTNHYPEDLLSRIPDSQPRAGRPQKILVEAAKTYTSQEAVGPQSQSVISRLLIIVS